MLALRSAAQCESREQQHAHQEFKACLDLEENRPLFGLGLKHELSRLPGATVSLSWFKPPRNPMEEVVGCGLLFSLL